MKPASVAPAYACIYPGLCEIAREMGYCLAIHGTVARDLDLIAIPWVDEGVAEPEELANRLMKHVDACLYPELLKRHHVPDEHIPQILEQKYKQEPTTKPHGRIAWLLYLDGGCQIDLSIMPPRKR